MNNYLIIATPPTPNGDLHLGHLSGPFLRADIYTKYQRIRGRQAFYMTGSDDHQSYVVYKGDQLNLPAAETAEKFADLMLDTLQSAGIGVDIYSRPRRSAHHIKMVQDFVSKLYADGKLITKEAPSLFCPTHKQYLYEVYVRGECPHCGAASSGNVCENCGRPNDCVDLRNPVCLRCGKEPEVRTVTRLYFPLRNYEQQLKSYYKTARMNPHLKALCERMLADGLPDITVSHVTDWGIPVPVAGFDGQRIFVWIEMAPGFLAAAQELADKLGGGNDWRAYWESDDSRVVQFLGFDNGYFFTVLFPALHFAYDPRVRPPKVFVSNEFYRLEGKKFSTSRNHAIWGNDIFKRLPADTLRFYLSYTGPETEQTNFSLAEYEYLTRHELVETWQGWLSELGAKASTDFKSAAADAEPLTNDQHRLYEKLKKITAEAATAYEAETFSPQYVTRLLCELVRAARHFGKAEEHWKSAPGRSREWLTSLALEVTGAKTLALLSAPIMPNFAERLWRDLGQQSSPFAGKWEETPSLITSAEGINLLGASYFSGGAGD